MKLGKNYYLVVRLKDGIEIRVNHLNWLLFNQPKTYWYYPRFYAFIDDLFDCKVKFYASLVQRKSVESLADSIQKAEDEIRGIIKGLTTIKSKELSGLERKGTTLDGKDD